MVRMISRNRAASSYASSAIAVRSAVSYSAVVGVVALAAEYANPPTLEDDDVDGASSVSSSSFGVDEEKDASSTRSSSFPRSSARVVVARAFVFVPSGKARRVRDRRVDADDAVATTRASDGKTHDGDAVISRGVRYIARRAMTRGSFIQPFVPTLVDASWVSSS